MGGSQQGGQGVKSKSCSNRSNFSCTLVSSMEFVYTKPAFSPATSRALSQYNNAEYQTVPDRNKRKCSRPKQTLLPWEEHSECSGPQRTLKTSGTQSEHWSWLQWNFKLRSWSISADNVILFALKLSAFHCGCHGNVVWKSASNWYQFLPRPRLTGRHAISSISDTKMLWLWNLTNKGRPP